MNELNFVFIVPVVISFVAMLVSYKAYRTVKKVNESTQQWHKDDMNLRNKELTLRLNKEYIVIAKPFIDIMYDSYNETKELTTEYSMKACRIKNNICDRINRYDNKLFISNDFLDKAISKLIWDNEDNILYQNPESLLSGLNSYSNLDEYFLNENSSDVIEQYLYNLYKKIDYNKRKELYNYAMEQLKEVHLIYKNHKELIDKKIELMENEYMKFKRYYFGNKLDILHEDYLDMLNLLKYIKYVEENYFNYGEISPTIAISKMFTQVSNIMIVNKGIIKMMKLENYRD